jgi:hypothetical protein
MDALEDYARRWISREVYHGPELEALSDWVRVLKVLFYFNILQCFFVVEHFTANAVSVAIGDNGNRLIQYNPSGHVITGDLNIIQHGNLRKVISHGPKFREPQHINWKHNFKIIMDAITYLS